MFKLTVQPCAWITFLLISLPAGMLSLCGCPSHRGNQPAENPEPPPYVLPQSHPDNENPLKQRFFQEPFRNLVNEMVQLDQYVGTPLVIVVFPSFLTPDGQTALLGLERLHQMRQGQFIAVFIPIETLDIIRPSIKVDPEGMLFLFRANDDGNVSLPDQYASFFWDPAIIHADYPLDPPQKHHVSPFYWVVDETGTIREKLIDYSDKRGVPISEVAKVLDALLGPVPRAPSVQESAVEPEEPVETDEDSTEVSAGQGEDVRE